MKSEHIMPAGFSILITIAAVVLFFQSGCLNNERLSPMPLLLKGTGPDESYCFTGAFLTDNPAKEDIAAFRNNYGKKPLLVMVFTDWANFIDEQVIGAVYGQDCVLLVSWEPWQAVDKEPIDYDGLLRGRYDEYITAFAGRLAGINKPVFVRFAHEMNGNWYPWAGAKIGKEKYIALYRYVRNLCDSAGAKNTKWIFCVNWEDIPPADNDFAGYYPGDKYVDYVGLDGYNWGNTRTWSKWMGFNEIFRARYDQIIEYFDKPVIITEFSSTSSGGGKAQWISRAMSDIKKMKRVKAFVLFNVDKETDWSYPIGTAWGRELKGQLKDAYFKDQYFFDTK